MAMTDTASQTRRSGANESGISVVIPAYNIEDYIARAVRSALCQARPADEIIVVNDGSTDGTREVLAEFGDSIQVIDQENRGLSGARNTGIRASRFAWIAFLDGDDQWLEGYLAGQEAAIAAAREQVMWSFGNFTRYLHAEERRSVCFDPNRAKAAMGEKGYFENYFAASAAGFHGFPGTIMIHREVFDTVGFFDEQQGFAEDLDMWYRISYQYPKVACCTEPCSIYYLDRPGTLTETWKDTKTEALIELVSRHLPLAREAGLGEDFEKLVGMQVRSWIRAELFHDRPELIRRMLREFRAYLSGGFVILIRLLMVCPGLTRRMCRLISRIVRRLGLRKRVVRRPG